MKRIILTITLTILSVCFSITSEAANNSVLMFRDGGNVIRVGISENYPPFSFRENGRMQGISVDILKRVSDMTGLKFEFVPGNISRIRSDYDNGLTDMIIDFSPAKITDSYISDVYQTIPFVVYNRKGDKQYTDLKQLKNIRTGIIKGMPGAESLHSNFGVNVSMYDNSLDMLKALADGRIDAAIDNINSAEFTIQKYMITNIKMSGYLSDLPDLKLRYAFHTKENNAYQKFKIAFNVVITEEILGIKKKWVNYFPWVYNDVLNKEERTYLTKFVSQNKEVKLCVNPTWRPVEFVGDDNRHMGFVADVNRRIFGILGVKYRIIPSSSLKESLDLMKNRQCDVFAGLANVPSRRQYMDFTESYISLPIVAAALNNSQLITNIDDLSDKKVAVVKSFAFKDILTSAPHGIEVVEYPNAVSAINAVLRGDVSCFIDVAAVIADTIQKNGIVGVKIAGQINENINLSYGIRSDNSMLKKIFNRAVLSIPLPETENMLDRWITIRFDQKVDHRDLFKLILIVVLVIAGAVLWVRVVMSYNKRLKKITKELELKNKELEKLSTTDKLTGAYNRLMLDSILGDELDRCNRYKRPMALIMFDIDNFKRVNDTLGHHVGDKVLVKLVETVKNSIRSTDFLGRWGGEEFLVIIPEASVDEAMRLAEKLRVAVETADFGIGSTVTCSFGVASAGNCDVQKALLEADCALYESKKNGKNLVSLCQH